MNAQHAGLEALQKAAPFQIVSIKHDGSVFTFSAYREEQALDFWNRAKKSSQFKSVTRTKWITQTMQQLAHQFNATVPAMVAQFEKQAAALQEMADKAERTGKKVGGYTLEQLREMVATETARSKNV